MLLSLHRLPTVSSNWTRPHHESFQSENGTHPLNSPFTLLIDPLISLFPQLNRHKKDNGDKNGQSSSGTASPDKESKKSDKHSKNEKPLPVPQTSSPRAHTPPRNASPSPAPPAVVITSSPVVFLMKECGEADCVCSNLLHLGLWRRCQVI